jgi:4-amino-4-deoxychorismate lyase
LSNVFFETIQSLNGALKNVSFHQNRVDKTAKAFGFKTIDLSKIRCENGGLQRVKVIYSQNGIEQIKHYAYEKKTIKNVTIVHASVEYGFKYLDRTELEALKPEGCDDIFIANEGFVTDTLIANTAFFNGKEWLTPHKPLLEGTTRQRLIQSGFLKTAPIKVSEIPFFQSYALMNAMIGFDEIKDLKIKIE